MAESAVHVEDKMSLEQFEQLKETFYHSNSDKYGYLTKDEFKVAISGLLGIHDQDHMLSLLFVKVINFPTNSVTTVQHYKVLIVYMSPAS